MLRPQTQRFRLSWRNQRPGTCLYFNKAQAGHDWDACFRSEFALESYSVQFSLVVSESASMGEARTIDERRSEPRRKHHDRKLLMPGFHIASSNIFAHCFNYYHGTRYLNKVLKRFHIWRMFSGERPLFVSFQGSSLILREPCCNSEVKL